MSSISISATGISPAFPVTAEEFVKQYLQAVTYTNIDGVQPPTLGAQGGVSVAQNMINRWFPWIDEKIIEPKYDGVSQYLGICSNQPTHTKDYHMIALMRAVDAILAPEYVGLIQAYADTVLPIGPNLGTGSVG